MGVFFYLFSFVFKILQHRLLFILIFLKQVLRVLHKTYVNLKRKPVWNDLNPKAVDRDELFGFIHPTTREWKDGN